MANVIEHKSQELQATAPSNSPMGSALAFLQGGGNIEQLNHMMDLQDRWEANEARKAFAAAMAGFKSEPVEIFKNKTVKFLDVKYKHAELSDVTDAIGAALAKHSLSFRWDIHQESGVIQVDCILTHVLGHSEKVTMSGAPDDSGKKNKIQQIASTTTYLQRYTLLAITGMSTKDNDDDGRAAEVEDPKAEQERLDWISAAEGLASLDEYKSKKAEVIKAYGDATRIPANVLAAFNKRFAELKAAK